MQHNIQIKLTFTVSFTSYDNFVSIVLKHKIKENQLYVYELAMIKHAITTRLLNYLYEILQINIVI